MDDDGTWRDCGEDVEIALDNRDRICLAFRTINFFGVTGPEHYVEIACRPHGS